MRFSISFAVLGAFYWPSAAAASAPDPCTVKAWVRADDLSANAVSHGELKVKLIQPCPNTINSIALRLRLDEYAEESTATNSTTSGEFWDWQGDTPMAEWSMTKHKRTAFKIEKTLATEGALDGQDWVSGAVFPFSVVSPNVNYPAAIYPLILSGASTETRRTTVGLGYRYTAVVTLVGPNGILSKAIEVPAGFTAFRPTEAPFDGSTATREVVVEATSKPGKWGEKCVVEGQGDGDQASSKEVKKMRLRVTLPHGGVLRQGSIADLTVAVDGSDEPAGESVGTIAYRSVSSTLNYKLVPAARVETELCDDNDNNIWGPGSLPLDEIHASMWRTPNRVHVRYQSPITEPLQVKVDATFPRTTRAGGDDLEEPPFRIEAVLGISVTEIYGAPQLDYLSGRTGVTVVSSRTHSAPAPEVGWEFSECDRSQFHQRTYSARIPVSVVAAGQPHAGNVPVHYLANGGRVPVPRLASGHLSSSAGISFEEADPVSLLETKAIPAPHERRDAFGRFARSDPIDAKAGQYVGALWQSRLHDQGTRHTLAVPELKMGQAVLQS